MDVECTGHLVAILRLEAATGEADPLNHVAIDDGEAFLLTAADEQWTVYLDIVDIDRVFVKGAAAHVVLRRKFVVGGHASLLLHHFLYGIAADGGSLTQFLGVQLFGRCGLTAALSDHHLVEFLHGSECDEQFLVALGTTQHAGSRLIAHHGEFHHYGVGRVEFQRVFTLQIGHRDGPLFQTADSGQFDGVAFVVAYFAGKRELLGSTREGSQQHQYSEVYVLMRSHRNL